MKKYSDDTVRMVVDMRRNQGISQRDVAAQLKIPAASVFYMLKRAEKMNLIERKKKSLKKVFTPENIQTPSLGNILKQPLKTTSSLRQQLEGIVSTIVDEKLKEIFKQS